MAGGKEVPSNPNPSGDFFGWCVATRRKGGCVGLKTGIAKWGGCKVKLVESLY